MGTKARVFGVLAALFAGLAAISPAAAVNDVNVSVLVSNNGTGVIGFSVINGTSANFGTVLVNAPGAATDGLVPAGSVTFEVGITGDDELIRPGGAINIKLGDGAGGNAYLDLTGPDPTFPGASVANFQIPGRYLSISGLNNPQQAKWTNTSTAANANPIWAGTNNNSTTSPGRVPREAGAVNAGKPIYKVGDIGGTFGNPASATCNVITGSAIATWPLSGCGVPAFSEGNLTKQIAYIHDGSGFVAATHLIQLSLSIPGGVYPGTYTGTLTLESTFS